MSQISPPIRILLVCAVAFMAAWMLFLRPSADAGAPAEEPPVPAANRPVEAGGEQASSLAGKAVEKANDAAANADATAEAIEGDPGVGGAAATTPAPAPAGTAPAAAAEPAKAAAKDAGGLPLRVLHAIADRKVVVLLFWTPKSADDRAVRKALSGIDRHRGRVVAHAAHVNRIAAYQQITRGADVEQSPTVVVVDRNRQVRSLVGYVDRTSIDQVVTDALPKRLR